MAAGGYLATGNAIRYGSEKAVMDSFTGAKGRADRERRSEIRRRLDIFRDDWRDILKARLSGQFEAENMAELDKVLDTSNNPLKRVIEDVSTIYRKPPTWTFEGDNPLWAEILENARAPIVQPRHNELVNLCNEAGLYVCPYGKWLRFVPVTPDNLVAWEDQDDPTELCAIAMRQGMVNTKEAKPRWHYWSKSGEIGSHQIIEGDDLDLTRGRLVLNEANPYLDEDGEPVLPIQIYHRAMPTDCIWDQTSGDDLFEATLLIGCLETWINHLIRNDSIALKYVVGLIENMGGQVAGANRFLQLRGVNNEPVSVGQFQSHSDWTGLGGQIVRKLQNVLNNNGLSMSDFQVSGDAQSGFSLRVRKEGLMERREKQIPLYECYDKQLYAVAAAVWNFERRNTESMIEGAELPWPSKVKPKIRYSAFQTTLTVEERAAEFALNKERMAVGLESPITLYQKEHPEASEEEASAALEKNKADSKGAMGQGVEPAPSGSPASMSRGQSLLASVLARREEKKVKPGGGQP